MEINKSHLEAYRSAKKEYEDLCASLNEEIEAEWRKCRFRWLLKKRRKNKIQIRVYRKNMLELFDSLNNMIELSYPLILGNFNLFDLVDIKDVTFGDKNYFKGE